MRVTVSAKGLIGRLSRRLTAFLAFHTPRLWRARNRLLDQYTTMRPAHRRRVFERIFQDNHWGSQESVSGSGSARAQTEVLRDALPVLFARHDIRTLLDVPCGDFGWMRDVVDALDDYVGADIVPALIDRLTASYSRPGVAFRTLDMAVDQLPAADAILARDVLIHFSYADIRRALSNIAHSNSTWLITTTYPGRENRDIVTGDWRPVDLCGAPFDLPEPVELIVEDNRHDNGQFSDKSLGLWRVDVIRSALFGAPRSRIS